MRDPGQPPIPISRGDQTQREHCVWKLQGGDVGWAVLLPGKGLRPHQPLCVPSGGWGPCRLCQQRLRGNLPGQEVDLGGQHSKQRWACLSHTWGDRCDHVCLGSWSGGGTLTLENRWPSEERSSGKGVTSLERSGGAEKHTLHRRRCSLQEAALQKGSLGLDSQGWGELSLWAKLSHQAPTDQPCRNTDSRGPISAPHPRQAGLKVGRPCPRQRNTPSSLQNHCKASPGPLPSRPPFQEACLPHHGGGPGVTAHTRHTLSRLLCGRPSRQSLIFKES